MDEERSLRARGQEWRQESKECLTEMTGTREARGKGREEQPSWTGRSHRY